MLARTVLAAAVGVHDHAVRPLASEQRHPQRIADLFLQARHVTLEPRVLRLHQPLRLRVFSTLLRLGSPRVELRRFQPQFPRHHRNPVLHRSQHRLLPEPGRKIDALSGQAHSN